MTRHGFPFPASCLAIAVLASAPRAAWKFQGCPDFSESEFKYETLVKRGAAPDPGLTEPIKMAFDMDGSGNVDVYWGERNGNLKVYRGKDGSVASLGRVPAFQGGDEKGFLGLALDPAFAVNRKIHLFFVAESPKEYRLATYRMAGGKLDPATERVLMRWPIDLKACCHNGGGMAFDAYGDLWITTGGNGDKMSPVDESDITQSEEDGAANTADYRGGILRIHPDDSPRGYSIPKGNFGEYFAEQARNAGQTARADEFRDTAKVKPEIFVKGMRNAYTLTLDPVRRWAMVGDVGPDNGKVMEEHNLFRTPAFAGWPYFAGKNLAYAGNRNAAAPANTSKWNTGLKLLPAAEPPIRSYPTACAITGPVYRYDGASASRSKLPPHFNRVWFIADFNKHWIQGVILDQEGRAILGEERVFTGFSFRNPMDIQQGPDGAIYIVNYAGWFGSSGETAIIRVSYSGSCRPALPELEKPVGVALARPVLSRSAGSGWGWVATGMGAGPTGLPPGARVKAYDLHGRVAWEGRADAAGALDFAAAANGVYRFQVRNEPAPFRDGRGRQGSGE